MMRQYVSSIPIFAREVRSATDNLAPNFGFHVHSRNVTIQVILRHVLIAAVLTLILFNVGVRIHVMIELRLRKVPATKLNQFY
jgi:hypothetical protein